MIAVAIILGFIALIEAMAGAWVTASLTAVIMATVVYSRLIRPSRTRR